MNELHKHTATKSQLQKRFYQWFDPFKIMKFCNYMRDEILGSVDVVTVSQQLLSELDLLQESTVSAVDLLKRYRELELKANL